MNKNVTKALTNNRESKSIEFKESFDVVSQGEWCEIIKDVVAIANLGGGIILIGVDNHGRPNGYDAAPILEIDLADITNKIHKYTGVQFSDITILEAQKDGFKVAAIIVGGSTFPIVFSKPGTYDIGSGKQKSAFAAGTVCYRHGAKSEPGNTDDIRNAIERRLETVRKVWIQNVRKVVTAPLGSTILVTSKEVKESNSPQAAPIRIVDDPTAPSYRKIDFDITHPYRLKDLLKILNERLGDLVTVNSYDILCLRRLYDLDRNPTYCHKPLYSSMQYSNSLVDWITEQITNESNFFENLRKICSEKRFELFPLRQSKKN